MFNILGFGAGAEPLYLLWYRMQYYTMQIIVTKILPKYVPGLIEVIKQHRYQVEGWLGTADPGWIEILPDEKEVPKPNPWHIAEELARFTNMGVDEAHDVVIGIIKKNSNEEGKQFL